MAHALSLSPEGGAPSYGGGGGGGDDDAWAGLARVKSETSTASFRSFVSASPSTDVAAAKAGPASSNSRGGNHHPGQNKKKAARIRTVEGSCWQCKDQRVLCKLEKPQCSQCERAGRVCEYGRVRLRWGNGVASRGRYAGHDMPVSSRLSLLPAAPRVPLGDDWHLLYFSKDLLPLFSLKDTYVDVDPVVLARDPLLNKVVGALSRSHCYSRQYHDDNASSRLENRMLVLRAFRQHLQQQQKQGEEGRHGDSAGGHHDDDASAIASFFYANVILYILDGMIDPTVADGVASVHLSGGRAILRQYKCLATLIELNRQGVNSVILSVFAIGDLTHALLSGEAPFMTPNNWVQLKRSEGWWTWMGRQDAFLDILAICCRLAEMGSAVKKSRKHYDVDGVAAVRAALDRACAPLPPAGRGTGSQSDAGDEEESNGATTSFNDAIWLSFCSAYRATAMVYALRAICGLPAAHPLVQRWVGDGVAASCDVNYPGKLAHCMLFPTLVFGAHAFDGTQRLKLRRTVDSASGYLSFGCVRILAAFLEAIWAGTAVAAGPAGGDDGVDWWDRFGDISRAAFIF